MGMEFAVNLASRLLVGTVLNLVCCIKRIYRFLDIPRRITLELFWCYIWTPNILDKDHSREPLNDRHKLAAALNSYWGSKAPTAVLKTRRLNSVLVPLVIETYIKEVLQRTVTKSTFPTKTPLLGARILDVRCGPGFLVEELVALGAELTGLDVDETAVVVAKAHWRKTKQEFERPSYRCATVREYCQERTEKYDIVVCAGLLEHTSDPKETIAYCCKLVRRGGCVLFVGPNRSIPALLLEIVAVEHILGFVPYGTQLWHRFCKPGEINAIGIQHGLKTVQTVGIVPVVLSPKLISWTRNFYAGFWFVQIARKVNQELAVVI